MNVAPKVTLPSRTSDLENEELSNPKAHAPPSPACKDIIHAIRVSRDLYTRGPKVVHIQDTKISEYMCSIS